jgi:hypothetical protein
MTIKNADMPAIVFSDANGASIEFSKYPDDVLVTIDDRGPHVDDLTYFSLTRDDLSKLIPKLTELLAELEKTK